jgi:hypothetical protein
VRTTNFTFGHFKNRFIDLLNNMIKKNENCDEKLTKEMCAFSQNHSRILNARNLQNSKIK